MIGQHLIQLAEVDSTNNYAAKLLATGNLKHGTVILAERQMAGKGQRGKVWSGSSGNQFTGTYFMETVFLSVEYLSVFNMSVALAVAEAIQVFTKESINIKWPNDVFVKNKKIAGILIETNWRDNRVASALVGIGVNIDPIPNVDHALSLSEISMKTPGKFEFLVEMSTKLNHYFDLLKIGEMELIKQAYLAKLWKKGLKLELIDVLNKENFIGEIVGVDSQGGVLISTENGLKVFHNHEISFELNYDKN